MKLFAIFSFFFVAAAATEDDFDLSRSTTIYIQAVGSSYPVTALAQIRYDPSKHWKTSTTATSSETFAQGYSPTFLLFLDGKGDVLSVAVKSGKVDAGETRDFGPKVKVVKMTNGKQPELNRPVVLSPEGKIAVEEPEKTLLQRYWWVGLAVIMLLVTGGGDK